MIPANLLKQYRPTVSVLLIEGDQVLFVQSSKDPKRKTWTTPQGGINRFERIKEAVNRELCEELGITVAAAMPVMLGEYVNPLPPDRQSEHEAKLMVCVAIRGRFPTAFRLNHENIDFKRVSDPFDLWNLMGDMERRRPAKFFGTFHAIEEAHRRGLLPWSCAEVLTQIGARSAA